MNATLKDYLMLHFIVLIWGFTAILGLLISLPAIELVFYRTLIASVGVAGLFFWKKKRLLLPVRDMVKVTGVGFVIAVHWILFFWSARVSTASVCLAGMATTSLWTAFVEPIFNRAKIKWYEVGLGLMVIVGLLVIFSFESGYWLGLSMALASSLMAAIFSVLNGKLAHRHNPYQITFYEMAGACLFTLIFMPIYSGFMTDSGLNLQWVGYDWFWLFLLGGVCTVYAFSVSVELMKRLSVFSINLTVNLEPVYGIVLAVLIFGESEKMTPQFYLGTAIILVSVLSYPVLNYLNKRRKPVRPLG
ncbi:DMT family transporter [Algoriphagus halophytocola]|uniref:DMT family transporter n=1 Tax=Algoriphagus halophytocola TaxID=2991499 RepID=A0ABY6MDG5_9BACT|nr:MULTISPECIES: DMT family transporter [unclassified Algoriphagus]UZD20920.1 DMT family transporter [Algoriphagus sp. TR-M5]WBL42086.1 DMT family transporter [Algoriphagus sp. TR-M9]